MVHISQIIGTIDCYHINLYNTFLSIIKISFFILYFDIIVELDTAVYCIAKVNLDVVGVVLDICCNRVLPGTFTQAQSHQKMINTTKTGAWKYGKTTDNLNLNLALSCGTTS